MNIEIVPPGCPVTLECGAGSKYGPMLALIDAEDYQKAGGRNWGVQVRKAWVDAEGVNHQETFVAVGANKLYLHRLIMSAGDNEQVKHKNGNGLDCRKANLIIVKKAQ
jgi:hypothetical protein